MPLSCGLEYTTPAREARALDGDGIPPGNGASFRCTWRAPYFWCVYPVFTVPYDIPAPPVTFESSLTLAGLRSLSAPRFAFVFVTFALPDLLVMVVSLLGGGKVNSGFDTPLLRLPRGSTPISYSLPICDRHPSSPCLDTR